jgi:predicted DNA-binding transcriptional regulator AlpA
LDSQPQSSIDNRANRHPRRRPCYAPDDPLLTAAESAAERGQALSTFWRDVAAGRVPAAYYVSPRSPRWRRSHLHAALEACRAPVKLGRGSGSTAGASDIGAIASTGTMPRTATPPVASAALSKWYIERRDVWPKDHKHPSQDDDLSDARQHFHEHNVTREAIRSARSQHAPASWIAMGRRKFVPE